MYLHPQRALMRYPHPPSLRRCLFPVPPQQASAPFPPESGLPEHHRVHREPDVLFRHGGLSFRVRIRPAFFLCHSILLKLCFSGHQRPHFTYCLLYHNPRIKVNPYSLLALPARRYNHARMCHTDNRAAFRKEVRRMVGFLLGCMLGGTVGTTVMCLCIASKNSDHPEF